jgi:DNA-directed RNA polymerase subunit RPC12/RpoP
VLWFLVFICLLLRDRYYTCPQCGARVRPFGGTDIPNWRPHPCPQCGLSAPPPPY